MASSWPCAEAGSISNGSPGLLAIWRRCQSASSRLTLRPAWDAVIRVATKHHLTAYDATYLELAKRTGLPLATLDGELRKAVQAANVVLVET